MGTRLVWNSLIPRPCCIGHKVWNGFWLFAFALLDSQGGLSTGNDCAIVDIPPTLTPTVSPSFNEIGAVLILIFVFLRFFFFSDCKERQ